MFSFKKGRLLILMLTLLAAPLSAASEFNLEKTFEITIGFDYFGSLAFDGKEGTSADIDGDYGMAFGLGYNLNQRLGLGMALTYNNPSYSSIVLEDSVPQPRTLTGRLYTASTLFTGSYRFSDKALTPFIEGGLGWTYIGTDIINGLPTSTCWQSWHGYTCSWTASTYSETNFTYNATLGLRWMVKPGLFFNASYGNNWMEVGNSNDTSNNDIWRLEVGFLSPR